MNIVISHQESARREALRYNQTCSLSSLLSFFFHRSRRHRVLDARDLPDHLMRDIGMIDGHLPPGSVR